MNLSGLLPLLSQSTAYRQLVDELSATAAGTMARPVLRAARPFVVAALARDLGRPMLVVAARPDRAQLVHDTLRSFLADAPPLRFPEPAALFYERAPWAVEVVAERLGALARLAGVSTHAEAAPVVVASARAVMFRTLPPRNLALGTRALKRGQSLALDKLIGAWTGLGYLPTTTVLAPGEFSRRGGILDIWPLSSPRPLRVELFGSEVETLRMFDPASQRSQDARESVTIPPASEALAHLGPRRRTGCAAGT